jgi:quercetin dioxygenase-like cupin family protein
MPETVDVWRLFALPDGTSSMERIAVKLENGRSGLFSGRGVQIVAMQGGNEPVWHTGPRRQLIATIEGEGELETGDGQKLTVKPGVLTLIEDLTGRGHLTRNGPAGRLCVFMPLDEGAPVA